jgi:hypothetical protein
VCIFSLSAGFRPASALTRFAVPAVLASMLLAPRWCSGQEEKPQAEQPPQKPAAAAEAAPAAGPDGGLAQPPPIPQVDLVPVLHTVPVAHDRPHYNVQMVNAALVPRDRPGIWVLDFAFKPLRLITVEVNGRRKQIYYLYYRVVNRTGKPRMFVPQFIMVNEQGQKFEDGVVPPAIPLIQAREDKTIPLLGAVNIMGVIPPSTKRDIDDAVFGVAVWDRWDPKADRFSIYVRGLSDGYKEIPNQSGGKPAVKYKSLRIDFLRRGDEFNLNEREIQLGDPAYDWVYW